MVFFFKKGSLSLSPEFLHSWNRVSLPWDLENQLNWVWNSLVLFSCAQTLLDGPWSSSAALEKFVSPWFLPIIVNWPIDSIFGSQLCHSDMFLCWHIFTKFFFFFSFLKGPAHFWSTDLGFFFNFRIVSWHFLDYVVASLIACIFDSLCLKNIIFFLIFKKSILINSSFFTMFLKLFSSCFFYFLLFLRWVPSLLFLFIYSISFPCKTAWFNFVLLFYKPLLQSIWKF